MRFLFTAILTLWASIAGATTYYVRTDGNNGNTGTVNSAGGAWATITKGCTTATAGDVVRVQTGTYVETVSGCVSGTSGNTVTLVADGIVITCSIQFSTNSYIRVIGFKFAPDTGGCSVANQTIYGHGTNTGLEFWNDEVLGLVAGGHGYKFDIQDGNGPARCDKCVIVGGSVHDIGTASTGYTALVIHGDDNFVGYVNFISICYIGVGPGGSRLRSVNLNFSGFTQCGATHPDFYYISIGSLGFSTNLVEANYGIGTITATDNKFMHAQNDSAGDWTDVVERNNVAYQMGAAFFSDYATTKGLLRWRYYHNTITYCDMAQSQSDTQFTGCGIFSNQGGGGLSASVFNNLFYKAWGLDIVDATVVVWDETLGSPTITKDYNLAYSPVRSETFAANWTGQAHPQTNVNPNLVSVGTDFTLGAGSGSGSNARGTGGPLTLVTSCSGSTINVTANTGSFFIGDNSANLAVYGGALVPGDFVTVNGTIHQLTAVTASALTSADAVSCSASDPVYFGKNAIIDIGAYPFKAGGYALTATHTIAGGTATITPNDASLVRFVVCYEDGIPTTIDNASPYSCTVGNGTVVIKAYPMFPGSVQSVTSTLVGGGSGPRIPKIGGIHVGRFELEPLEMP